MNKHRRLRKQVYELGLADLERYPVWEFALNEEGEEGQDEATVRPVSGIEPIDPRDSMYIVAAVFVLADGSKWSGCISTPVQGQSDVGTLQPVLILGSGERVVFWCGTMGPSREQISAAYFLLAKQPSQVFPLEVSSVPAIQGGPVRALVSGFMQLEDFRTGAFRVIT